MTFFNVLAFGAATDGELATEPIQAAIDQAAEAGGVVVIPEGVFQTGTLELRSGVTLLLERGAVLRGSQDLADYADLGIVHNEWGSVRSLIVARAAHDIAIRGEGTIDFNGSAFFDFTRPHSAHLDLSTLSDAQLQEFEVGTDGRPNQAIFLLECTNVRVGGVQLVDSPCWGLCVSSCDDVRISDVRIRYSKRIPNADGIHLVSCHGVIVDGCDIVSGDDCIAVTGIADWTRESRDIIISNCLLSSSSAGVRLGFWNSVVRNVIVQNCIIRDSVRGITVMSCGSGLVENVLVGAVSMETRGLAGTWWGAGEGIYISGQAHDVHNEPGAAFDADEREVNVKNITFRDVSIDGEYGLVLLSDRPNLRDIRFMNLRVNLKNSPNRAFFGDRLDTHPGSLQRAVPADSAYWLYAENVRGLLLADTVVTSQLEGVVDVAASALVSCEGVTLRRVDDSAVMSAVSST